jgi:hypothetical protein
MAALMLLGVVLHSQVLAPPTNLRLVSPLTEPAPPGDGTAHTYFNALTSRSDHWRSYSLRDQAQLVRYSETTREHTTPDVNYIWPNDPDPRRQDAAKLIIPSDGSGVKKDTNRNSIYQVRVPMGGMELGHSYLVTWDAFYGDEWRHPVSGLIAHKAFMLDGPFEPNGGPKIWWETHHDYRGNKTYPVNQAEEVGNLSVRYYGSSWKEIDGKWIGCPAGPNVASGSSSFTPTLPYRQWKIQPERWVRHWVLVEYGMDSLTIADYAGGPLTTVSNPPRGTLMSMWAADEDRDAVQIYNRLQVTLWQPGVREFWIEMNTSTNEVKVGRPNLVAYFRNIVMLKDVGYAGVPKLLQRPKR